MTKRFIDLSNDEWVDLINEHLVPAKDIQTIIIVGHLLLEYVLNSFIEASNESMAEAYKGFSFNQKMKIYTIFCSPDHFKELKLFNQVRNDIAHTLETNDNLMREFVHTTMKSLDKKFPSNANTIENRLKIVITYLLQEIRDQINTHQTAIEIIHRGFMDKVNDDLSKDKKD